MAATFSSRRGCVLIGLSARTNAVGAAALLGLLDSIGLAGKVVNVPRGTLHLKTDCSLIDEETILATAELARSGVFEGFRVLCLPSDERHAANALRVNDVVFIRAGCPRTFEMLMKHGSKVVPLPVSEIAQGRCRAFLHVVALVRSAFDAPNVNLSILVPLPGAGVARLLLGARPAFSGSLRRSTLGTIVIGTNVVGPLGPRTFGIVLALFRRPGRALSALAVPAAAAARAAGDPDCPAVAAAAAARPPARETFVRAAPAASVPAAGARALRAASDPRAHAQPRRAGPGLHLVHAAPSSATMFQCAAGDPGAVVRPSPADPVQPSARAAASSATTFRCAAGDPASQRSLCFTQRFPDGHRCCV